MEKINRQEFGVLWEIAYIGKTDPKRLLEGNVVKDIEKAKKLFLKLEKKGLIRLEYRDGEIYGGIETEKGKRVIEDKRYDSWIPE